MNRGIGLSIRPRTAAAFRAINKKTTGTSGVPSRIRPVRDGRWQSGRYLQHPSRGGICSVPVLQAGK